MKLHFSEGYPLKEPLAVVSFRYDAQKKLESEVVHAAKQTALDAMPSEEEVEEGNFDELGASALLVIMKVQELIEEFEEEERESEQFLRSLEKNAEKMFAKLLQSLPQVLGRRLIYSHHIIASSKRKGLKELFSALKVDKDKSTHEERTFVSITRCRYCVKTVK